MLLLFQKFIYRADIIANSNVLYLMGDNEQRVGKGGQAKEMRGERNTHGIRTKRAPLRTPDVYWSDDDYERQIALVDEDFQSLVKRYRRGYSAIVCPLDGLGTGEAQLHTRAPRTLQYIDKWLINLTV